MAASGSNIATGPRRAITLTIHIDVDAVIRWVLGIFFIAAALSKLGNPTVFLGEIYAYQTGLPDELLRLTAVTLPWLELLCGLMLLVNFWRASVPLVLLPLFGIFLAATGQAWLRGLDIACGCLNLQAFGLDGHGELVRFLESARFAFLRNLLFTAATAYLFIMARRERCER